jgi:hypothetical protein
MNDKEDPMVRKVLDTFGMVFTVTGPLTQEQIDAGGVADEFRAGELSVDWHNLHWEVGAPIDVKDFDEFVESGKWKVIA